MSNVQRPTSIGENTVINELPKDAHAMMPTWALIGVLIVAFFVLKTFIYIKDPKRHGK